MFFFLRDSIQVASSVAWQKFSHTTIVGPQGCSSETIYHSRAIHAVYIVGNSFLGSKLFGCVILCAGSKTIFVHVLGFQFGLHLRRRCKLADMRPDEFMFPNGNGEVFVRTHLKGIEITSGTRISAAERLQLVWSLVIHLKIRGGILFTLQ